MFLLLQQKTAYEMRISDWSADVCSSDLTLSVEPPKNDFPILAAQYDEPPCALIAGGIGITPIASMAAELTLRKRPFTLHYYGHSRDQMGFVDELAAQYEPSLHIHAHDEPQTQPALEHLPARPDPAPHPAIYVPRGMTPAPVAPNQSRVGKAGSGTGQRPG